MSKACLPLVLALVGSALPLQGQEPAPPAANLPGRDDGLELSAGYSDQSVPNAPQRAAGFSVRGGWDLAGSGPFRLQAHAGFQRAADAATTRNSTLAGLQATVWSPDSLVHGLAGLEWRAERVSGPGTAGSTVGRGWFRAGFGFRGIVIPFRGWHTWEGGRAFVPFTRVSFGTAFTGPTGPSAPAARRADRDVVVEIGFRLFLDSDHLDPR